MYFWGLPLFARQHHAAGCAATLSGCIFAMPSASLPFADHDEEVMRFIFLLEIVLASDSKLLTFISATRKLKLRRQPFTR